MTNTNFQLKPKHPDAESAYTFGLISLICFGLTFLCGCFTGVVSIVLGLIAVSKAKRVKNDFMASPGMYHVDSLQKAETARIMGLVSAIIGIVVTILWILFFVFIVMMNYLEKNL